MYPFRQIPCSILISVNLQVTVFGTFALLVTECLDIFKFPLFSMEQGLAECIYAGLA